jgi:riboflavin kinase/FMN adenylyltransferase
VKHIVSDSLGEELALPDAGPVFLAIGMFDGVHIGHRAVLGSCLRDARMVKGRAGVLTFQPHPSRLFHPQNPVLQIQELWMKEICLASLGFDFLIEQRFHARLASICAEDFPGALKRAIPELNSVYVGANWCYGKGRTGNVESLATAMAELGIRVVSQPRVEFAGESVSSTRIRKLLEAGKIEEANALLGYAYFSRGEVVSGRQLGRTIGFPTLNMSWNPELKPRYGVYGVEVEGSRGQRIGRAIANYGVRPTVQQSPAQPVLEVHLLEKPAGDLPGPGDTLQVKWLSFVRPEMRFASIEELKQQIQRDVEAVQH